MRYITHQQLWHNKPTYIQYVHGYGSMIDIKLLKKNKSEFLAKLALKRFICSESEFDALEQEFHSAKVALEESFARRNALSAQFGKAMAQKSSTEQLSQEIEECKKVVANAQARFDNVEERWNHFCSLIPNCPDDTVPVGASETDNVVIKKVGEPARLTGLDHTELLAKSGLLMTDAAAALSGARFNVLKGPLAKLHRALIQFMLAFNGEHGGYQEYYVPYLVRKSAMFGTGQLPKFHDDLFHVDGDNGGYYLIPTAEVPLTNLFADQIRKAEEFPVRLMAHTPCFRAEAGSYGKDLKGIFRQHQFEKVELVHCVLPDQAEQEFQSLVNQVTKLLTALELPHQQVALCAGDLGFSSQRTIDFEVWMPGQQRYREISSCSYFGDFQARRMKARYKNMQTGQNEFIHTINGSGIAVGRALIALIENHGTEEGCAIPKALQPFCNNQSWISWA